MPIATNFSSGTSWGDLCWMTLADTNRESSNLRFQILHPPCHRKGTKILVRNLKVGQVELEGSKLSCSKSTQCMAGLQGRSMTICICIGVPSIACFQIAFWFETPSNLYQQSCQWNFATEKNRCLVWCWSYVSMRGLFICCHHLVAGRCKICHTFIQNIFQTSSKPLYFVYSFMDI